MVTQLCELATKYGTDKGPSGHNYTPIYHLLLAWKKVKKVLEIGIASGASLRMWEEYFPEAEIYGLDTNISDPSVPTTRIKCFQCDQSNLASLLNVIPQIGANFDLIVDDASHRAEDQVLSAHVLLPLLTPEGVYVIEDVSDPKVVVFGLARKCVVCGDGGSILVITQ
jgi:predicted O-methyltransferase YrrM